MKFFCVVITLFFAFEAVCALNEDCTKETCPEKEKTVCISNTCQCDKLSKFNDALKKCLTYATEFGGLCFEDWQCQDFLGKNSACSNNACLCKSGYRWYQGECRKYAKKGESCDKNVICLDESNPLALKCSHIILSGKCECSKGYYERGEDCRLKSELDKECAINSDCFSTKKGIFPIWINSTCQLGKCVKEQKKAELQVFNNTFTYSDGSYLRALIDKRSKMKDPEPDGTKCPKGVSSSMTKEECLECQNTLYFKEAACICKPGFFLLGGECVAELGMKDPNTQYKSDKDCPIRPGKAVSGTCYCRDYWFQDSTNRECKKTTLQYTRNCLDNDWCKAMGPYAYCNSQTSKCQCIAEAVLNETNFYCELKAKANLTGICLEDSECPLYETCSDEKCQCNDGFYRVEGSGDCKPKIGYSCEVRDCGHIKHALCDTTTDTCQCKDNSYVTNGLLCLKKVSKLYGKCMIQAQCGDLEHAQCAAAEDTEDAEKSTTQCLCEDEYRDLNGTCYAIKTPGATCSTLSNCTVMLGNTFECRNGLCQCPLGKTLNADSICVTSSANLRLFNVVLSVLLTVTILVL